MKSLLTLYENRISRILSGKLYGCYSQSAKTFFCCCLKQVHCDPARIHLHPRQALGTYSSKLEDVPRLPTHKTSSRYSSKLVDVPRLPTPKTSSIVQNNGCAKTAIF
uniref:Uncharacterized protein n=1 Tax=Cacopsylla melanoneura TaxID=428564 RepID=A0A8D8WVU9_9HEMI